jgi:hypothetical protein
MNHAQSYLVVGRVQIYLLGYLFRGDNIAPVINSSLIGLEFFVFRLQSRSA